MSLAVAARLRTFAVAALLLEGLAGVTAASPALAATFLFDASHHEMAGNADWVVDADAWNLTLPAYPCSGSTSESNPGLFPTPAQAGITPTTPIFFLHRPSPSETDRALRPLRRRAWGA